MLKAAAMNTMNMSNNSVKGHRNGKDVEAGSSPAVANKHYVPVVELFRGHWAGILVQTTYEACECPWVLRRGGGGRVCVCGEGGGL